MKDHPHVLVLMCDQMQHDRMGFVDGIAYTPTLDRIAREGVHFSNAFTCQGQCVPARAAFLTGLYAHECGVMVNYGFYEHQNRMGARHLTLGQAFRDQGYRTAYFGKTHFGIPLDKLGFDVAFDIEGMSVTDEEAETLGIMEVPQALRRNYVACDKAADYLQNYEPDDTPLFFMYSTNLPHPPFFMASKYEGHFDRAALPLPASYREETYTGKPAFQKEHVEDGRHGAGSEAQVREMLHQYYTMIAAMDEAFGRVVTEFERLGLWEDTVVLVFADHGDMMGSHHMRLKGTIPYDELYRIPCLMKLPKGETPTRSVVDDLVSSERLAGTLMQAAGLDMPEAFHHGGFYDVFTRTEPAEDQHVFFEHYAAYWGIHPFYGIRTPTHKYIRYYGPDDTEEMYDLEKDPHELCNAAADPACRTVKTELAARADAWWQETDGRDFAYYESDHFRNNQHNPWPDDAC